MDTVLGLFDFATANLATIVTVAFAFIGLLSQVAAAFNLSGLAQVSTTLHDGVQFVAGNWGKAANVAEILRIYREQGPNAALARLRALAPNCDPRSGWPPSGPPSGLAPAALLLAVALAVGGLTACAPVTAEVDRLTGTSLADRCRVYLAGDVTVNLLATAFPELAGPAAADDALIKVMCAQPATGGQ